MSYDQTTALYNLLPPGTAFSKNTQSNTYKLVNALAQEPTRTAESVSTMISEANPSTMNVNGPMLDLRYEEAGLPDPCRGIPATRYQQQQEILAKWMNRQGSGTAAYMTAVLQAYGYVGATVTEYTISGPSDPNNHKFIVNYYSTDFQFMRVDSGKGDDFIETATGLGGITCIINRIKPAHTTYDLNMLT